MHSCSSAPSADTSGPEADGTWQVISTSGDTHLGGEDFDHRVMDYFVKLIKKKYQVDVSGDKRALAKLRREAERAKRALSSSPQVHPDVRAHPLAVTAGAGSS